MILPTISFVGAANAVVASGARPVFCDVDDRTLNPTARLIDEKITSKTKAVIVLHYGGVPCLIDEICDFAEQKKLTLIEDSACSIASRYKGKACGTFGDIGLWSFDAMKILVTGDGGMIYCNTPEMSQRLERNLYLGLANQSGYSNNESSKWWEFEIASCGRRAIMNDVASAIGLEQLKKLPEFIARRRCIHEQYNEALAGLEWLQTPPKISKEMESSYYLYWIQTTTENRDRLALYFRERGIYTTFRYYPLHWVKHYDATTTSLPNAEETAQATLCLPLHQSLSNEDVEKVVKCIGDFGRQNDRLFCY